MNPFAYPAYQAFSDLMLPLRHGAALVNHALAAWQTMAATPQGRELRANCDLMTLAGLTHSRPPFEIDSVEIDGKTVAVIEEVAAATPFCSLVHFAKETTAHTQPRVLVVAPMSGHFATLLRGTVRTVLADHDVYITDWHNPRDISLAHGRFGFDEYVQHIIDFIEVIGPGAHLLAVCQPTVASLAAVALMAADNNPAQPASMTLMAGPIDTRINPTRVNDLAKSKPLDWFEKHLISTVPFGFAGAHRRVYPGFMQLNAFMAMNLSRHFDSFADMHYQRAKGDPQVADAIRVFYEEYFATMDLTADFYLETVDTVFQRHSLPLHELEVRGRKVEPSAIRRTALLTIEGERDDICAVGQTLAAQDLCDKLRPYLKTHHVQTGVGHYGVFNGKRWERHIYPRVRAMIHDNEASPINVNARSQPIVPLQSIPPMHNPAVASVLNEPGKTGKAGKTGADIKAPQRRSAIAPEHMIDPQELAEDVPGTQAVKTDGDSDLSASRPS
ncbi:polyhydroxyalkanoate depolymerase, intracellular [Caballeronia choica]|uniref:Polyhydroxyalkanoate depolymerase, intracellular n=1 Tax=Caballeronia choica TaxID=326476 RepID=A0A158KDM5_9BURK|nr:polyhydroxyalkanoate depolymerase [Caballeronia choica]SAL78833.1 polyhydroxyalkanoate depolymerase, intracellular [Caballeronia choica]